MAIKDKTKANNEHRLSKILTKEYKYENLFLGLVAVISAVFAVLIIKGVLTVDSSFPIIGGHPEVFGWVLLSIAVLGIILALYPFYKPALPELRKISYPSFGKWMANTGRVVFFMAFFIGVYVFFLVIVDNLFKVMQ